MDYQKNEKELIHLSSFLRRNQIEYFFEELLFLGLVEMAENRKILRATDFARKLLKGDIGEDMPILREDDAPLNVQPNFEILLP